MSDPRLQITFMLQEIIESKVFASEAKAKFDSQNSSSLSFTNMLLQTSLRHLVYIKKILNSLIKKKIPNNSRLVFYLLILGCAEIIYLNTPDYAVINSYVELIKQRFDKYLAGFANAILRNICQNKQNLKEKDKGEFFPSEFRRLLNSSYNKKTINEIERSASKEPLLDITLKKDIYIPNAIDLPLGSKRLPNNGKITEIIGYSEGDWWVQDFSSSVAVKLLGNICGLKALDVCAAPGGKTAQLINNGAKVTALDISAQRLEKLKQNLTRLQLQADNIICADAAKWLENNPEQIFDIILLDAPCSATGTLRRHPELVHIKNTKDVDIATKIQKELLRKAASHLSIGGKLIYCTCSLSKQEGEAQIIEFLDNNPNFKTVYPQIPDILYSSITQEGWLRILPHHLHDFGGTDGFFIAILKKEC